MIELPEFLVLIDFMRRVDETPSLLYSFRESFDKAIHIDESGIHEINSIFIEQAISIDQKVEITIQSKDLLIRDLRIEVQSEHTRNEKLSMDLSRALQRIEELHFKHLELIENQTLTSSSNSGATNTTSSNKTNLVGLTNLKKSVEKKKRPSFFQDIKSMISATNAMTTPLKPTQTIPPSSSSSSPSSPVTPYNHSEVEETQLTIKETSKEDSASSPKSPNKSAQLFPSVAQAPQSDTTDKTSTSPLIEKLSNNFVDSISHMSEMESDDKTDMLKM